MKIGVHRKQRTAGSRSIDPSVVQRPSFRKRIPIYLAHCLALHHTTINILSQIYCVSGIYLEHIADTGTHPIYVRTWWPTLSVTRQHLAGMEPLLKQAKVDADVCSLVFTAVELRVSSRIFQPKKRDRVKHVYFEVYEK